MLRKIATWAVVIFLIYYFAADPHGAASLTQTAWRGVRSAGGDLATFVGSL